MKKLFGLALLLGTTLSLTACGGLPTCNQELDECDRGGPYTEERTVQATPKRAPAPAPVVTIPEPTPVMVKEEVIEPAPAPVVVDTQIMRSAEPEFTQISK